MNDLQKAEELNEALFQATEAINTHLTPILKRYIDFAAEMGWGIVSGGDTNADFYFDTIDGRTFHFEAEETYAYGEYHTPTVELPFEFIEDPEGFMNRKRKEAQEAKKIRNERAKEKAEARVAALQRQLESAQKTLTDLND